MAQRFGDIKARRVQGGDERAEQADEARGRNRKRRAGRAHSIPADNFARGEEIPRMSFESYPSRRGERNLESVPDGGSVEGYSMNALRRRPQRLTLARAAKAAKYLGNPLAGSLGGSASSGER